MGVLSERRVGMLGGTFDPVHYGHLAVAEDCRAQLGLDEVLFVPAGGPPHKQGRAISPARDRLAMVELAIADNPRFRLSRIDVERPGLSYSVDTVQTLQARLGPEARIFFIIGADSLADLPRWRDPDRLAALCQIVAVNRPGYPMLDLVTLEEAIPDARRRIIQLATPGVDVSATQLRQRVAEGRPIRYLVPDAVRAYIQEHRLYRSAEVAATPAHRV